jgi:DNA-binding XRE family transcriptional regulator
MSIPQFLDHMHELDPDMGSRTDEAVLRAGPVGNQLFAARTMAKLTQVALAELSGVRQGDISDIENGRGNPTKRTLEKLGVALNIDFVIGASSAA